jgi:hypothetical protein
MREENYIAVMTLLDAVFEGVESQPEIHERLRQYAMYVGWLESSLIRYCPDEKVQELMASIRLKTIVEEEDEEVNDLHAGSFY